MDTKMVTIVKLDGGETAIVVDDRLMDAYAEDGEFVVTILTHCVQTIRDMCDEVLGYADDQSIH